MDNIVVVGPRAIGKTTFCRHISERNKNIRYVNFDVILDRQLEKVGGLKHGLKTQLAKTILNHTAPQLLDNILSDTNILLELGSGVVSSPYQATNEANLRIIRKKALLVCLLYSPDVYESTNILFQRDFERKEYNGLDKDEYYDLYFRFTNFLVKSKIKPLYTKSRNTIDIYRTLRNTFEQLL